MRRWDNLLDNYIDEYSTRGVSAHTIYTVRRELERWGAWMRRKRPRPQLEAVESDLIIAYITSRSPFKAKSTVYGIISKMRGMGDFLVREGVWSSNPLRWIQGPRIRPYNRMPKRIEPGDMQAMWSVAAAGRSGHQRHLWITILALLYGTGLRRGELSRLSLEDWHREDGTIVVDGRKTGQQRAVPVPELVYRCIETYLPHRHNHLALLGVFDEQSLFLNSQGKAMGEQAISNGIRRIARQAGVELHSLHQFRHSCASDLLASGIRMPEVQRILGHQRLDTTMRYLHIADPERHEAIARHPLNDWLQQEVA